MIKISFRNSKILLIIGLMLILSVNLAQASSGPQQNTIFEPVDIVLVIDDSGSMYGNSGNDNEGLRYAAARLLLDLALPGDRVAVVRYGNTAQVAGMADSCGLTSFNNKIPSTCTLTDSDDLPLLKQSLAPPQPHLGSTCMQLGLELARQLLLNAADAERSQAVIFLTDGIFTPADCGGSQASTDLATIVNRLIQDQVAVYPVLLGSGAATRFGQPAWHEFKATTAEDLFNTFSQVYAELQPNRYAVILQPGALGRTLQTTPGQAVTKVSFVVRHEALKGLGLDGTTVPLNGTLPEGGTINLKPDERPDNPGSPQYDIVTVAGNPVVGEWALDLRNGSNLALAVVDTLTTPTLLFPTGKSVFAPRAVAARNDGYLVIPAALRNGELVTVTIQTNCGDPVLDTGPNMRILSPREGVINCQVQAGDEPRHLKLERGFSILPGNYPRLKVISPLPENPGLQADGSRRLEVTWDTSQIVTDTSVQALIFDKAGTPLTFADFECSSTSCVSSSFKPEMGQIYDVWFLAQATTEDGVLFNDYARVPVATEPLITVTGIPLRIDLNLNPGPFEFTVTVQAQQSPGNLEGLFDLRDPDGQLATCLKPSLVVPALPGSGSVNGLLSFDGSCEQPGVYGGTLTLAIPGKVEIRPNSFQIVYEVPKPEVPRVKTLTTELDFGEWLNENDVLSQTLKLEYHPEVRIAEVQIDAASLSQSLNLKTFLIQPEQTQEGEHDVTVRLQALEPLPRDSWQTKTITGELVLSLPDGVVEPPTERIPFTVRVSPYWLLWLRCEPELNQAHRVFCWFWPFRAKPVWPFGLPFAVQSCFLSLATYWFVMLIVAAIREILKPKQALLASEIEVPIDEPPPAVQTSAPVNSRGTMFTRRAGSRPQARPNRRVETRTRLRSETSRTSARTSSAAGTQPTTPGLKKAGRPRNF